MGFHLPKFHFAPKLPAIAKKPMWWQLSNYVQVKGENLDRDQGRELASRVENVQLGTGHLDANYITPGYEDMAAEGIYQFFAHDASAAQAFVNYVNEHGDELRRNIDPSIGAASIHDYFVMTFADRDIAVPPGVDKYEFLKEQGRNIAKAVGVDDVEVFGGDGHREDGTSIIVFISHKAGELDKMQKAISQAGAKNYYKHQR